MEWLSVLLTGVNFYIFLFAVLMVVATLVIFKMSGASSTGLVASFLISVLLTSLAFYIGNPNYGLNLLFWLAIGLGAVAVMYFSKTWSGFAASLIVAGTVIALVFYSMRPELGLTIAIIYVVALVLMGVMAVAIYAMKQGYGKRKEDKVTVRVQHPDGRVLIAEGVRGGYLGPAAGDPAQNDPFMAGLTIYANTAGLPAGERARQLMTQQGYAEVLPLIDDETARAVRQLERGKK